MITILVNNANKMLVTSTETIMQYSKNAHQLRIFVPKVYYEHDMTLFNASLEIVPPNQSYKVQLIDPTEPSNKDDMKNVCVNPLG